MPGPLFDDMMKKAKTADGFLAALDQSGGSTPKALKAYGVPDDEYTAGEVSMYDKVHEMRTRMITSPSFTGEKIIGAILFENTMDREIEGMPTGQFLWEKKGIVPFIKCDKGLAAEENGVQLMKPMPTLDELMVKSAGLNMFGTKMRSVIKSFNEEGIKAIVAQQFEVGKQIIGHGLCPILEPEVDITSPDKEKIEEMLATELIKGMDALDETQNIMIKLSLPTKVNLYKDVIAHPRCVRLVALSGGYGREEANEILSKQEGMIASFSRALLEGLSYGQSQEEFDATMAKTVDGIYLASKAP
mmetsp:Transcript_15729/g.43392  ORF Transcript_15729/g.43392 Transcript_15729/m.43392 type:complete len:302 (+) Transcript_15729:107-1012(+)|eukprot:CAMPEP_0168732964 /NCGR_PEP_ID=MMETSP0724-20121128/8039_1 /TAXON_ID=265536 /ORGANISM="Amphiprora sp., Strain CCMP467" /LENGTH=301 /DNA_ID=CAMNT_0008779993 /DNA_START=77 /DNA_END=982 /DNA_ORIENTATION=-